MKKHTLLKPHLFISRHLNQLIKYILPIYQIILIGLCPLMLFYFQVYLFTIPIFFSFLFLPQGHLAVFQWRLTLLQNLAKTYFYFEGDPLKLLLPFTSGY